MTEAERPVASKLTVPKTYASGWKAVSLFSGCGGLDLGFLNEGIFTCAAYDIDRKALATRDLNFGGQAFVADLTNWSPDTTGAPVLLAGAPCQGFSTAGKRDIDDPRNNLLGRVGDIALAGRAKVVIVENVPAAVSGVHRRLWEALEDRLRFAGFNVRRVILEGEGCGLSQHRKRLFLLCWVGSDCINVQINRRQPFTLRETLADIDGVSSHRPELLAVESRDWLIAQHIKPGQKLSNVRTSNRSVSTWDIPEVYGTTNYKERAILAAVAKLRRRDRIRNFGDGDPVHIGRLFSTLGFPVEDHVTRLVQTGFLRLSDQHVELRHTYNGRYRRLSWDELSPTVDTRFGRADLFLHPDEHRGFTPREAARIQGFPDNFEFIGNSKDQFVQIGNAVPPPMAAVLAEFVREAILKA